MTTYGPHEISLEDRIAGADAVAVVAGWKQIAQEVDKIEQGTREIGTFELSVREPIETELPEVVRVRAVRREDGSWPLPEEQPFVALLQEDRPGSGEYVLVHDSAFPLAGSKFEVPTDVRRPERTEGSSLAALRRVMAERAERRKEREDALRRLEGKAPEVERPVEAPDSALGDLLAPGGVRGGRPDEPGRPEAGDRPAPGQGPARPTRRRKRS